MKYRKRKCRTFLTDALNHQQATEPEISTQISRQASTSRPLCEGFRRPAKGVVTVEILTVAKSNEFRQCGSTHATAHARNVLLAGKASTACQTHCTLLEHMARL